MQHNLPVRHSGPVTVENQHDLEELIDTDKPIKLGLIVIGCLFGGILIWAGFAPLAEGVPTEGIVSLENKRKVVQHLTGGIVTEILVKEGQVVKKGDTLMRIDNATAQAKYQEIRQYYLGLRAAESRLLAEKNGKGKIVFHKDLLATNQDPEIRMQMQNQTALMQARQSAVNSELAGIQEMIKAQQAQIEGYKGILKSRETQLELTQQQFDNIKPLVAEGYVPQVQQLELSQKISGLNGEVVDAQSNILRLQKSIAELQQRLNTRRSTEQKDIDTEMAKIKLEVDSNADKFKAISGELKRTEIVSPSSGQVVDLQIHTIGAVIQPAQKLMEIVPQNEALILESRIAPNLIDRVKQGQEADVRFSSFSNTPMLSVKGKVETVSEDLITDQPADGRPAMSYYLARISVTEEGLKKLADKKMQPGMPLQVIINTGERSLLTYWLHPLTKRLAASLTEE